MQLSELKLITASNIINLRTSAGLTQAQLGEKLNYSDKSISKWERGEAVPDAYVLLQLAEIFGVSVDYILSSHDKWEPPVEEIPEEEAPRYSVNVIIAIAVLGVMTISLTAFVTLWIFHIIEWRIFLAGATVAIITYLVLDCVFHHARSLLWSILVLEVSLLLDVYFLAPARPWQIFVLIVPAFVITALAFKIKMPKAPEILNKIIKK